MTATRLPGTAERTTTAAPDGRRSRAADAGLRSRAADAGGRTRPRQPAFRPDIQGLRAVAVLLVVLAHAGVGVLSGGYVGVDVFFVISGFVITRSLLSGRTGGRVPVAAFYAARARRILPMATGVLLATMVASWQLLNPVRAAQVTTDALWAGVFAANVHFARLDTDYFAADRPPSPLQHYWSLAVEEQFYLVWPLLIGVLLTGSAVRRRRSSGPAAAPTGRAVLVLAALVLASFAWSVRGTAEMPAAAFFSGAGRAWELGVGALLAVGAAGVARIPEPARVVLSWAGLAGIAAAALLYTPTTAFPGAAAALPVLSTAAVIAGTSRAGAAALLRLGPLQAVGGWSYSLYLLHWPVLVLAAGYAGRDLATWVALVLMAATLGLSWATYRLVEQPFRTGRRLVRDRRTSLLLWPTALVLVLVAYLGISGALEERTGRLAAAADSAEPAPGILPSGPVATADPAVAAVEAAVTAGRAGKPLPPAAVAAVAEGTPDFDRGVCHADAGQDSSQVCKYGDVAASRSIALVGDSHAMMWFPALDAAARAHHWVLYPLLKPNCTTAEVRIHLDRRGAAAECDRWRAWAMRTLAELRPDRIVSANYQQALAAADGSRIQDTEDWVQRWFSGVSVAAGRLKATGAAVTFLGDVPGLGEDPADCLLRRKATAGSCMFGVSPFVERHNQATRRAAENTGARYVDVLDWFCADGRCPSVIGGTVAYVDDNHVSRTYARRLAEPLATRLGLT